MFSELYQTSNVKNQLGTSIVFNFKNAMYFKHLNNRYQKILFMTKEKIGPKSEKSSTVVFIYCNLKQGEPEF